MKLQSIKFIAAFSAIIYTVTSTASVYTFAASSGKANITAKKSVETTVTTTVTTTETSTETTTETTTKKTVKAGSKGKTKRGSSSKATTETTTEPTTQATTIVETTTETTTAVPVDELGLPLTGVDLTVHNIIANTPKDKWSVKYNVDWKEDVVENNDYILKQRNVTFENGDIFYMHRYNFKKNDPNNLITSLSIPGDKIEIRYIDPTTNEWYMSTNIQNSAYETMYIDTDKETLIVGVPAVYLNDTTKTTLQRVPEQEKKIEITKENGSFRLTYQFPRNTQVMGEIWVLRSQNKLANWNDLKHFNALKQDLSNQRRFSWDGYYFPIPSNYKPYAENMLYRHPSNYVGASFVKNGTFLATKELGYVMTKICMANQNAQGYWQTGPQSEWLMSDFSIDAGFYDTRFNTDFAENLLNAYTRYNDEDFLKAVVRYGEYFISHANNNSYSTENGGLLVEDYGHSSNHIRTHVSLNHQLAEINLLYKLYDVTKHKPYLELADKMLLAIDDTKDQWVLPSNNLNYALHYTGTYNTMIDYPYLTYNDLYTTRHLLNTYFNKTSPTIQYLMDCKMEWMKANNVTGYYE